MQRLLKLIAAGIMIFGFVGCEKDNKTDKQNLKTAEEIRNTPATISSDYKMSFDGSFYRSKACTEELKLSKENCEQLAKQQEELFGTKSAPSEK